MVRAAAHFTVTMRKKRLGEGDVQTQRRKPGSCIIAEHIDEAGKTEKKANDWLLWNQVLMDGSDGWQNE